ncbi:hypothetical protein [Micromonospora coxensis]|uniref:hypothetical protein n=1 Tax=Micromonospora coxensis TaxID=356852 RepID=UPI001E4F7640|nr:hypothetical protein [Micromonospora coxensis]
MTRDDLEGALRETLSRRVAAPPPLAVDPAGLAIRQGRRIRRRRMLTGVGLAMVATSALTAGMAQLSDHPGRVSTPVVVLGGPTVAASSWPVAPAPDSPPADGQAELVVGGALLTADGKRHDLGLGPVERAQRLPERGGWLVVSARTPGGRTLWVVPPGESPQVLLAGAEEIALTADGRRVGWRDGDGLYVAGLVGRQLVAATGTTGVADAVPVRFVGDRLLVRARDGGHLLWQPGAGPLPAADRDVLDVYGVRPDGRLAARVPAADSRRSCLALLDPATLEPARTGCGAAPTGDGLGAVSADGRWLLVNGSGGTGGALLVDLTSPGLTARAAGPAVSGAVAWSGSTVATYVDRGGVLARVRPDRTLAGEWASSTRLSGVTAGDRPVVVTGGS